MSDQPCDGQPSLHYGPSRAIVLVISAAGRSLKCLKSTFSLSKKKFFHQFLSELLTESSEGLVSTHISEAEMCRVGYQYVSRLWFYLIWTPIAEGSRGDPNLSLLAKVTLWSQVLSPQRTNCSMEVRVSSYLSSADELGLCAHSSHWLTWHSEQWAPIPASPQTCQEKQPVNVSEAGQIQRNYQGSPRKMLRSYRRKRGDVCIRNAEQDRFWLTFNISPGSNTQAGTWVRMGSFSWRNLAFFRWLSMSSWWLCSQIVSVNVFSSVSV